MTIVTTTVDSSGNVLVNALDGTYLIPQAQASAIAAGMLTPAYELAYDSAATGGAILESLDTNSIAPSVLILNAGGATPYTLNDWTGLQDVVLSPINGIPIDLTVTGSQNLTFYSTDEGTPPGYTANGNYQVTLVLNDTGNDVVNVGNASGDSVILGAGSDKVTTGTGTGDQVVGGTGANQTLIANGANATMTDGTGAHQTLEAFGGNSTINVDNGPSDTVISQDGNNTINVAAFAGTETITGTSTDTLNIHDFASNATITPITGGEQIVLSDTGQTLDAIGITNITFLTPLPHPTTIDENATGLATQLSNNQVDPTNASTLEAWAAAHLPADGLTPVEIDNVAGDTITAPVPDAEGTGPQFLILQGRSDNIDTSNFAHLHAIVVSDNVYSNDDLSVTGTHSESIYLGDLNGDAYNNGFVLGLSDSGNDHVYGGSGNGDTIHASGSTGNDTIILGNGESDEVDLGAGADHVTLGTGAGELIYGGTGDNQVLKSLGTRATLNDGTGNGQELDAFGGTSTINLNGGNTGELVKLAASGANTVNIGAGAGSIEITGLAVTDHLNFADTQANATATKVSATEEIISFVDTGQSLDLHFANHTAEVAVIGSIHWGV